MIPGAQPVARVCECLAGLARESMVENGER
jgi:hypothetical protein